jgi:predicted RecA/RadA family phage recombinase
MIPTGEWKGWGGATNAWTSESAITITITTMAVAEEDSVAPGSGGRGAKSEKGLFKSPPKRGHGQAEGSPYKKSKSKSKGRANGSKRQKVQKVDVQKVDVQREELFEQPRAEVDVIIQGLCSFCEGDATDDSNKIVFCEVSSVV